MEYRNYRDTGLKTSLLGFGCMRFPMLEDGKTIDQALTEQMIDKAYQAGVNYFDTAYVYQNGGSELAMGAALKNYPRESFFIADKFPNAKAQCAEDVLEIFNTSLERCGVEYFDFYLCHNVGRHNIDFYTDPDCYAIKVLEQLKAEGKIRFLGFSSHGTPEELQRMVNVRDWDFAQIQLNYLDWGYQNAEEQYKILKDAGIPIMVMEPVRGGRLATLGSAGAGLTEYAPDKSQASWALRWAASHDAVQVVLSGMSDMAQVEDNLATFSNFKPVTQEECALLEDVAQKLLNSALIPCTGCRYCDGCPLSLDIPLLLKTYSDHLLSKDAFSLIPAHRQPVGKQAADCLSCGICASTCPQNINIPGYMAFLATAQKRYPMPL